jgi:hypothetical protein
MKIAAARQRAVQPGARPGRPVLVLAALLGGALGGLMLLLLPEVPQQGRPPSGVATSEPRCSPTVVASASRVVAAPPRLDLQPPALVAHEASRDRFKLTGIESAPVTSHYVLQTFDPQTWRQFPGALETAIMRSRDIDACGRQQAARSGRSTWAFAGVCAMDVRFAEGKGRLEDVDCASGEQARRGDPAFQDCLKRALVGLVLPCQGCRTGDVVLPWPIQVGFTAAQAPRPTLVKDGTNGP